VFRIFFALGVFSLVLNTVRLPGLGISVSDFFILGALGIWFVEFVLHDGKGGWNIPAHPLWLPGIVILFGGLLSSVNAVNQLTSISITLKIAFVLTVWVAMGIIMVQRGDFYWALWSFVGGVFFTSLITIEDRFTGWDLGGKISGRNINYWSRSDGTVGHPVELGFLTSAALPIVAGLLIHEWHTHRRWWWLCVWSVVFVTIFAAMFFAGSVAGYVSSAFSLGVLAMLLFARASHRVRLGILMGLAIVIVAASAYLVQSPAWSDTVFLLNLNVWRATTITGPERFNLLDQALSAVDVNPFVGAGMDQSGTGGLSRSDLVATDVIHNVVMGGWLGGGLFVVLGILWSYVIVGLTGLNAVWRGFRSEQWLIVGLGASALGWILFDQTQPHLYHRHTWLILALLFGLGYQVRFFVRPKKQAFASSPEWKNSRA
jgi:hypothetical protein